MKITPRLQRRLPAVAPRITPRLIKSSWVARPMVRFPKRALLVSRTSLLARLVARLPMWVPLYVVAARVGTDSVNFAEVGVVPAPVSYVIECAERALRRTASRVRRLFVRRV